MVENLDRVFLERINENIGIAYKVSRVYFRDADTRQDVMQEMMYQLWRSYQRFDEKSKFSTWMYSVCLHTALTYRRKNRLASQMESISPAHHEIPEQGPDDKEAMIGQLTNAVSQLSPLNKAIVLLYLENLSYDEISNVTGLSRSNVSVRLVRIKKELETKLS